MQKMYGAGSNWSRFNAASYWSRQQRQGMYGSNDPHVLQPTLSHALLADALQIRPIVLVSHLCKIAASTAYSWSASMLPLYMLPDIIVSLLLHKI